MQVVVAGALGIAAGRNRNSCMVRIRHDDDEQNLHSKYTNCRRAAATIFISIIYLTDAKAYIGRSHPMGESLRRNFGSGRLKFLCVFMCCHYTAR